MCGAGLAFQQVLQLVLHYATVPRKGRTQCRFDYVATRFARQCFGSQLAKRTRVGWARTQRPRVRCSCHGSPSATPSLGLSSGIEGRRSALRLTAHFSTRAASARLLRAPCLTRESRNGARLLRERGTARRAPRRLSRAASCCARCRSSATSSQGGRAAWPHSDGPPSARPRHKARAARATRHTVEQLPIFGDVTGAPCPACPAGPI